MRSKVHAMWMKLGIVLVLLAVAGLGYSDTYTWRGGSGSWSDPSNWSGGAADTYPGTAEDDIALIPVNTSPITINVDVEKTFARLYFTEDVNNESKLVTLTGTGSLSMTGNVGTVRGAGFGIEVNRKCELAASVSPKALYLNGCQLSLEDGATITHNSIYVYANSTMTMNGGNILSGSSVCSMSIRGGGRFIQNGGYVYTRLNVIGESSSYGMGTFIQNGGVFHNRYRDNSTIADDGSFTLNGGTFRQGGAWTTNCIDWASRLYPVKKGTVTDILYYSANGGYTKYFNPFGKTNCDYAAADTGQPPAFTNDYPFAGTLMCTNSTTNSGYPSFLLRSAKATIGRQGGALVCDRIVLYGMTSEIDFRLSKIVLKKSFDINNNSTQINFPNGIEFGAFGGDWSMTAKSMNLTSPAGVNLYGECMVDTTDYLDGTTGRNITLYNLFIGRNRTSLAVKGVGAACLYLGSAAYDSFRRIEVYENATLELNRHADITYPRVITANELELGRNATLKINALRAKLDAIHTRIDPTAKIHVTIFASQTAARKTLVASFGAVDGEIDESNFVLDNQGSVNWRLVRSGSTFYITDGSAAKPPTSPVSGRSRWLGTDGGNWNVAGNWDNGVPRGDSSTTYASSIYADFYDSSSWCVTNDIDDLSIRLLYFYNSVNGGNDCGPYTLNGKGIRILAGNSVYNEGTLCFPVVINNPLLRPNESGAYFNAGSSRDNSVALAGGVSVPGAKTYISLNGDWRLGGAVTTLALVPGKRTNENARPDKFTILSNATVTVSSQGTLTNNYAAAVRYNIERTGQLKFTGGTSLDFPAGFESAYHTIYGTLDVGIPLKFGVDQHFHGTGDVKVQSVAEFAATKARVHLSGGVTLKPAAWTTATAADGVTAITVDGTATIEPTADITYGASSDAVTSTAAERALEITDAGELTLVASAGRTVTLTDPISGEGKLTISGPGAVSLAGGVSVGELAFSGNPKIVVSGENPITATTSISLDGVEIVVPSTSGFANWTTVVSAPKISGTPIVPLNVKASVAVVDDHMELQLKGLRGFLLTIH